MHVQAFFSVQDHYDKASVRPLGHVQHFAAPWIVARQTPLSMGFSRQEFWSELLYPPPGDLPNPGTEPESLKSPALAGGLFTTSATGNPL